VAARALRAAPGIFDATGVVGVGDPGCNESKNLKINEEI
jgi:hypothetical protein